MTKSCSTAGTLIETSSGLVPIEALEVGDRVSDPVAWESDLHYATDVVPSWKVIHVLAPSQEDPTDTLDIYLLRPPSWLVERGARVSGWIHVDVAGLRSDGMGLVAGIWSVRHISDAPGHMVLMTVTHRNDSVLRIAFDGGGGVIEPTANHPLYSVDRGDWMSAGALEVGERVRTKLGPVSVVRKEPLGSRQVFNLEVESAHSYLVGSGGIWAHNDCDKIARLGPPGRVEFKGTEVRGVRDMSHISESTLRTMAKDGFAMRDAMGRTIILHHHRQNADGPLVEMPGTKHSIGNSNQHPYGNTKGAGLTEQQRQDFDTFRGSYRKARATEELGKRGLPP